MAKSASDYDRKLSEYDADIFENFYAKSSKEKLPVEADILTAVKDSGVYLGGTVDQAKAAYVAEWERLPSEYAILIWHWAQQPTDDVIQEMELMATEVVFPEIGGLAPPEERPRAQWALERSHERSGVRMMSFCRESASCSPVRRRDRRDGGSRPQPATGDERKREGPRTSRRSGTGCGAIGSWHGRRWSR